MAVKRGYTEIVELLLSQRGINVNIQNRKGNTALYTALDRGKVECVKLLLKNVANPNIPNNKRNTAF